LLEGRLDGRYQIRRSGRARRLRITVRPAGVEVVAPLGMRDAEIAAFIDDNQRWIESKLEAIRRRLAAHAGSRRLADGATIPFRGGWRRLRVVEGRGSRTLVRQDGDVRVELAAGLRPALRESEIERVLTGCGARQAHRRRPRSTVSGRATAWCRAAL
jgi:predicted metal-dependent hydrolase